MGSVDNSRLQEVTRTQNAQFVSFLEDSGFRQVNFDCYEVSMRRRRRVMAILFWLTLAGFGWIVVESARALSLF